MSTSAKAIIAIRAALKYALIALLVASGIYVFYISFGFFGALMATCIGLAAVLMKFLINSVEAKQ